VLEKYHSRDALALDVQPSSAIKIQSRSRVPRKRRHPKKGGSRHHPNDLSVGSVDMPDKSSVLSAAPGVSTVGVATKERERRMSRTLSMIPLNGPKALERFDNTRRQEQEAYWSAQHGMSKRQQTLTCRQVEREEEEQRDSLKLLIAMAVEEAVAKKQAEVDELEVKLSTVRGEAKANCGGVQGANDYLSLYEEKRNLRKQLIIEQHVHQKEVSDLEARLDEYADDQETRFSALTHKAATFTPTGFEERLKLRLLFAWNNPQKSGRRLCQDLPLKPGFESWIEEHTLSRCL
ncbi:MAG: hypothetical protein M1830_005629, partial [Pleopsidium flavum]